MNAQIIQSKIEKLIFVIRGQKVMLDSDLAELYGVETKRLIEQVKRNLDRFPEDFMFECTFDELEDLRSQIATANRASHWNYKRRTSPFVFTEQGIAMLSSVLNSPKAIEVNIAIMRIFVRVRSFLYLETHLGERVSKLEQNTAKLFKTVFERMDDYEKLATPLLPSKRRKIGLKNED